MSLQPTPEEQLGEFREIVDLFNNITDRCFSDCVVNFRTKKLSGPERKCILACSDKWISSTQRITRVFVEQQWLDQQAMQDDLDLKQ